MHLFGTNWRASCSKPISEDTAAHSKETPLYNMLFKVGRFVLQLFCRKGIRIIRIVSFLLTPLATPQVTVNWMSSLYRFQSGQWKIYVYTVCTSAIYTYINTYLEIGVVLSESMNWSDQCIAEHLPIFILGRHDKCLNTCCWTAGEENKIAPFCSTRDLPYLTLIKEQHNYKSLVTRRIRTETCDAQLKKQFNEVSTLIGVEASNEYQNTCAFLWCSISTDDGLCLFIFNGMLRCRCTILQQL